VRSCVAVADSGYQLFAYQTGREVREQVAPVAAAVVVVVVVVVGRFMPQPW
jgi:hypothetical protein